MGRLFRLLMASIWVTILWAMLGGILAVVATEAPDWMIVLPVCGSITMVLYIASKEFQS